MKTKKFLSVVLTLCVLLAMCSLAAFAADETAVTIVGDMVTLTVADTDVLQAVLDGQYGSIDGKTIVLPAGDYGQLELGRATKYAGSNTVYMVGGFDSSAANYQEFDSAEALIAYKNGTGWTPNCFYRRALKNVTLRAADGAAVTIAGVDANAGHIYGTDSAHKYDYVRDVEIADTNKSYYMAFDWNNISFEGLCFSSTVNFESSAASTQIDGVHFADCTFNPGYTARAAAGAADAETLGRGIHFANWAQGDSTDNLKNLTVDNCRFTDCYQGVYTNPVYGVSVTNCTFTTIKHNAIAIQDSTGSAVNHGAVVITDNVFNDISDRIIRFNNVGADTKITITGNTTNGNVGDTDNQVIKATTLADGITYNISENAWGEGKVVANDALEDTVSTYVAEVGGAQYATLAEAITAAKDGDTVTLLADTTEDVVIAESITLDLGAKTLTGTAASGKATLTVAVGATAVVKNGTVLGTANSYYAIQNNGTLTLEDVTATAGNTGSSMLDNWGTLTITSGTYTGGLNVVKSEEGSTLTINGGTFTLSYSKRWEFNAVILVYGNTTITGGTFIQNAKTTSSYPQVVMTGVVEGYTSLTTITGGTFKNNFNNAKAKIFWAVGNATADNFAVSGGSFNKAVSADYCAEGFIPTKNADGIYGVKEGSYVAEIDGTGYETLAEAIAAAKAGKTVKLLADVEQNSELTVGKSITLDLAGKKIYNTADIWNEKVEPAIVSLITVENGADVTVTGNGTIAAKENDCYAINVKNGNLTIENGTVVGNVTAVQVEEGSLTINGGSFSLLQKWDGDKYLINCIDDAFKAGSAKVAIYGGTFEGFDPNVSPEAKVDGKVPSFAAPGVGITKNADGSFTAEKDMTAQILDASGNSVKAYATLAEAFAAAKDGETVLLLADTEVSEQLTVGTAITLDLGGKTLTSTYAMGTASGKGRYALLLEADVTLENGTFKAGEARAVGAYGALTLSGAEVSTALTNGNACVALCASDKTYSISDTTISGAYALSIFANNATVDVSDSTLEGNGNVLYHNGTNYGLKLTVADSTIESTGSLGVYISGSTATTAKAGYQQASFTNCTITGLTAVEVKYTDLTLDNCTVTATDTETGYVQDNNGPAAHGFAVVSTDNAMKDTTPKPEGSITVKGDAGKYTGPVGLGSLASVKTDFTDFKDETVKVSGGTFSMEVPAEYCADGYASVANADGTYTVKEAINPFGKSFSVVNKPVVTVDGVDYYAVVVYSGIDSLNYRKAGFAYRMEATKKDGSAVSASDVKETTVAYKAVTGTNNAGEKYTYTAEQIGAAYIYGQRFLFPVSDYTSANTALYVTPYVVTLDGETVYGDEITLTEAALVEKDSHLFWQGQ